MPRVLTPLDLVKNELQQARVQNLASAPSSPVTGQIYYNSGDNRLFYFNGTDWVGADGTAIAFGSISGLQAGGTTSNGSAETAARSDHVHATPAAAPVNVTKAANAAGSSTSFSRADHKHDVTTANPAASAVGDTVLEGTSTSLARADHRHAREAFGSPVASAVGDTSNNGSATSVARSDHRHAREAFGNVSAQTSFGGSSANGSAATVSRSDHTHGTPTHDNAAHSAINLSALAAPTGNVSWGSHKITNLGVPTADSDAATKGYADSIAQGLDVKASVRAATTANITLSGTQTIDGVSLVVDDRVLVKNQTTAANNGIYLVKSGAWVRSPDADTSQKVTPGMFTFVESGTANGDTGWVLTTDPPITLGTTALTFAIFSTQGQITAGAGLTKTGNEISAVAGTGISVNGGIAINTSVVPRKHAATIGNGTNTEFTITHNLGTRDVIVQVYESGSPWAQVIADVEANTTSAVVVRFASAPASNAYRVVVQG